MAIIVVCQFCRKRYRFRDDAAGQSATCEHCGDVMTVPLPLEVSLDRTRRSSSNGSAVLPPSRRALPPRPVDPSDPAHVKDPSRPAVSDLMYRVGIGLQLVIWDAIFSGLILVVLKLGPVFVLPDLVGWVTVFRILAGLQLTWVVVLIAGMGGRTLCLLVPEESQARPVIITTVVLEFFAMCVTLAVLFHRAPWLLQACGHVASLLAHVMFLAFLKRLAIYLRREDLLHEAQTSLALGALFVVAAVMAVISRTYNLPAFARLFTIGNFIIGPLLFFPYLRLLMAYRQALKELE